MNDTDDDPWHFLLLIVFFSAVAANSLYVTSRWINLIAAAVNTRCFTKDPNEDAGIVCPGQEPHVTIHICCYNEGRIVEETIARACSVHWPLDKLSVHVLDDSTDQTSRQIVSSAVANWSERGVDIEHRIRPTRIGYKAGNLRHNFDSVRSEYIAYLVRTITIAEPSFIVASSFSSVNILTYLLCYDPTCFRMPITGWNLTFFVGQSHSFLTRMGTQRMRSVWFRHLGAITTWTKTC